MKKISLKIVFIFLIIFLNEILCSNLIDQDLIKEIEKHSKIIKEYPSSYIYNILKIKITFDNWLNNAKNSDQKNQNKIFESLEMYLNNVIKYLRELILYDNSTKEGYLLETIIQIHYLKLQCLLQKYLIVETLTNDEDNIPLKKINENKTTFLDNLKEFLKYQIQNQKYVKEFFKEILYKELIKNYYIKIEAYIAKEMKIDEKKEKKEQLISTIILLSTSSSSGLLISNSMFKIISKIKKSRIFFKKNTMFWIYRII
jgi:hypothetical protein